MRRCKLSELAVRNPKCQQGANVSSPHYGVNSVTESFDSLRV